MQEEKEMKGKVSTPSVDTYRHSVNTVLGQGGTYWRTYIHVHTDGLSDQPDFSSSICYMDLIRNQKLRGEMWEVHGRLHYCWVIISAWMNKNNNKYKVNSLLAAEDD